LDEIQYHKFSLKFGASFEAGIGAEAVYQIFKGLDIKKLLSELVAQEDKVGAVDREKLVKRVSLVKSMIRSTQGSTPAFYGTLRLYQDTTADYILQPPKMLRKFDPRSDLLEFPAHLSETIADTYLPNKITAVAAIGNPQRFFDDLLKQGIAGKCIGLADHASYTPEFFSKINAECILITEKDAVKCTLIKDERIWVVPMSLELPNALADWLQSILQRPDPNQYTL
jgi:tetraacyldisaccharide-1-P 4'-kinase